MCCGVMSLHYIYQIPNVIVLAMCEWVHMGMCMCVVVCVSVCVCVHARLVPPALKMHL